MKYTALLLLVILASCTSDQHVSEARQADFADMAQTYQTIYMGGSDNCEEILSAIHENITMWENGKKWTYAELEQFCPHLPKKNVAQTYNDQRLLDHDLGYDFVSQLYVKHTGDTMRETVSRIWQKTDDAWKITSMNNLIMRE